MKCVPLIFGSFLGSKNCPRVLFTELKLPLMLGTSLRISWLGGTKCVDIPTILELHTFGWYVPLLNRARKCSQRSLQCNAEWLNNGLGFLNGKAFANVKNVKQDWINQNYTCGESPYNK